MLKLFKRPRSAHRSAGPAQPLVERYALNSGERQTATELSGIRGDHVTRYETAVSVIEETLPDIRHGFVLDAFCGNGYGTHLLCERLQCHAMGIDASPGAIQCANAHYASGRIFFCQKEFPFDLPKRTFDAATCLESLEHVEGADALVGTLARALKPGGVLFMSTPNEDVFPHDSATHKFHVRHFRREDVTGTRLPDRRRLPLVGVVRPGHLRQRRRRSWRRRVAGRAAEGEADSHVCLSEGDLNDYARSWE